MKEKLMLALLIVFSLISSGCNNSESSFSSEATESGFSNIIDSSSSNIDNTTVFGEDGWDEDKLNYVNPNPILHDINDDCNFFDYSDVSCDEVAKITGILENYLMENNMLGISLMNTYTDFVKISDRISLSTNGYIYSYGFGIIEDGSISSLSKNEENKTYYHTVIDKSLEFSFSPTKRSDNPYRDYISSSYFSKKLNKNKDGFIYFPSLATNDNIVAGEYRPLPIDENNNVILNANRKTTSSTYRIYVKTGEEAKYNSLSTDEITKSYVGTQVELEDYLTPFKQYFNRFNYPNALSYLRGLTFINGLKEYFETTESGFNAKTWESVGIKSGSDNTGDYLQFTFIQKITPFDAMYYLSDSLYSPIPSSYLDKIGGINNYMSNENTHNYSLSVGPYLIEDYCNDKVVLKKNENINKEIIGGESRYNIEGIHIAIDENANDLNYIYNLYNDGLIDYAEIPEEFIKQERDKKDTYTSSNNVSMKLMMNTSDKQTWEQFFGENGTICQTNKEEYWNVKPAMSNDNFLKGLQLSINRQELAVKNNTTPTLSFFAGYSCYDPENSRLYMDSSSHKQNLIDYYGSKEIVNNYGFDLDESRKYFALAANELLESGEYKEGDVIEIEMCWQNNQQTIDFGEDLKTYIEKAFNDPSVCNNKLSLNIINTYIEVWSDIYYKKMYRGQYDIAYGYIAGGNTNPFSILENFKSDNSSGFTLNWGEDTNSTDQLIEYDNKYFTYDALLKCASTGGFVNKDGSLANIFDAVLVSNLLNDDGTRTITINYDALKYNGSSVVNISNAELWYYDSSHENGYQHKKIDFEDNDGIITIVIDAETVSSWVGEISIDLTYSTPNDNYNYIIFETLNNKVVDYE